MIIYRPHKGSLTEALQHKKEFNSEQEMKEYIVQDLKSYWGERGQSEPPFIEDIVIDDDTTDDDRCGWHDTRYVCIKRFGNEDYMEKYGCPQCIGMCATDYERRSNEE